MTKTRLTPATIEQAKTRWHTHTRKCLGLLALRRARERTVWSTDGGIPIVTTGTTNHDVFAFYLRETGNCYAAQRA